MSDRQRVDSGIQIAQALTRPMLVAGCERTPFGIVVGLGAGLMMLAWQSWSVIALMAGAIILSGGLYVLRAMARTDPQWWQVYGRSLRYRRYYPARSTPYRDR